MFWVERKTNGWGVGQDWVWFDVEKEYGGEDRKVRFFGHIAEKSFEND